MIDSQSFSDLSQLESLVSADNALIVISNEMFRGMVSLEKSNLDHNKLEEIPHGLFSNLNILELSLRYNNLTANKSETFSDLTNLKLLDIGFNKLVAIEAGSFDVLN